MCPECGKRIDAAALAEEARFARDRKYDWFGFALSPLLALLPAALLRGTLLPATWYPFTAVALAVGLATWFAWSALERRVSFGTDPSPERGRTLALAVVLALAHVGWFAGLVAVLLAGLD